MIMKNLTTEHRNEGDSLTQDLSQCNFLLQVTAELQKKEQKLHEVEMALSSVTLERNQAIEVLKKHGLLPEGTKQVRITYSIF